MNLKKYRKFAGISQKSMAEHLGTSPQNVASMERQTNPKIETINRYLKFCGFRIEIEPVEQRPHSHSPNILGVNMEPFREGIPDRSPYTASTHVNGPDDFCRIKSESRDVYLNLNTLEVTEVTK